MENDGRFGWGVAVLLGLFLIFVMSIRKSVCGETSKPPAG
jgi:hypothetical protein